MKNFLKRAYAEIHLDRAKRNVEKIRAFLNNSTELMAVVKANAYGHDEIAMAQFFEKIGIKYFAVSNINEALQLRKFNILGEIFILGYTSSEYAAEISTNNIISTIISKEHGQALSKMAESPIRCHIAVDTGMGRIGIRGKTPNEAANSIIEIMGYNNIQVEGIFTHLSAADSWDPEDMLFTSIQQKFILDVKECLKEQGIVLPHTHFYNSAGATYYPNSGSTLARFGIMLYGLYPNNKLVLPIELEPVMDLKAEIVQVKLLEKGNYVSYGRTYQSDRDMIIATVTIGYADGVSRKLSGNGSVLIHGKRAPIIGKICMDQLMVDVTNIPNVSMGDIATIIGTDGKEVITADDIGNLCETIGYEVVCGISKRIPRVVMFNNEIVKVLEY